MAGETLVRIHQIIDDLRESWYFRVWAFVWLLLALVVFSGLIILSQESNRAKQENDIVLWVQNETQINFPRFHVRLDHRGNEVFQPGYPICTFGNQTINTAQCQPWFGFQPPQNQCVALETDKITAFNDWKRGDQRIQCEAITDGEGYNGNMMMAFEFEGQHVYSFGALAYASTWFAPNDMAWILLQKNMLQQTKNHPNVQLWESNLLYHSTVSQPNVYNFTTIMSSFLVRYYQPRNTYNGWMAVGSIGGVGFFMVCLHTLFMILIGFILANTSSFLSNSHHNKL